MKPKVQFATAWVAEIDGMPCQVLVYKWRKPLLLVVHHRCATDCLNLEFDYEWDPEDFALGEAHFKNCLDPESGTRTIIENVFAKQKMHEWPIP